MPEHAKMALWLPAFSRFLEYVDGIDNLINITRTGAGRIQMMPRLTDILDEGKDLTSLSDHDRHRREKEKELADLAADEVARGFPLLYAHSTVSAWGALEVLVNDLAVAWLAGHPEPISQPPLGSVKLPV